MKQAKRNNAKINAYGQEKSGSRFGALLFGIKMRWAGWMRRKSDRLSLKGKWFALLLFCLTAIGLNAWLVLRSLKPQTGVMVAVSRIRPPKQVTAQMNFKGMISDQEIKHIQHIQKYLDSLAHTASGEAQYRRLMEQHPGLLDSLRQIEQLYQQQKQ